jgi:NTP pyrophosphatase (non-canonical NTP hydrolase)
MKFEDYQRQSKNTVKYPNAIEQNNLLYIGTSLAGEVGEVCNELKKVFRDSHGVVTPEAKEKIIDEAGDVMWYLARLLETLEVPMDTVLAKNIEKLIDREEQGVLGAESENPKQ